MLSWEPASITGRSRRRRAVGLLGCWAMSHGAFGLLSSWDVGRSSLRWLQGGMHGSAAVRRAMERGPAQAKGAGLRKEGWGGVRRKCPLRCGLVLCVLWWANSVHVVGCDRCMLHDAAWHDADEHGR